MSFQISIKPHALIYFRSDPDDSLKEPVVMCLFPSQEELNLFTCDTAAENKLAVMIIKPIQIDESTFICFF